MATLAYFIVQAPSAHAGSNIVVDTPANTGSVGKCSLRDAMIAANNASVVFGCNGTASVWRSYLCLWRDHRHYQQRFPGESSLCRSRA